MIGLVLFQLRYRSDWAIFQRVPTVPYPHEKKKFEPSLEHCRETLKYMQKGIVKIHKRPLTLWTVLSFVLSTTRKHIVSSRKENFEEYLEYVMQQKIKAIKSNHSTPLKRKQKFLTPLTNIRKLKMNPNSVYAQDYICFGYNPLPYVLS